MKNVGTARKQFSTKPLAAAVALALIAPAAFADNGMPGAGLVVRNVGGVTVNGVPLPGANQIIGLSNGATIQSTTGNNTVIQWGSPAVLDTANKAGFNLAAGNTLNFTAPSYVGFLNIDISGTMSMIAGKIIADGNSGIDIANEKGITVAGTATIVAPKGLTLVGANLNTIQAIDAYATPGAVVPINNTIQMNFAGNSPVTVAGANLSGVATYLLVAGSGAVSLTGTNAQLPAAAVPIYVVGGVGSDFFASNPPGQTLTVNDKGAASAAVRSSAKTDVTIGLGTSAAAYDATTLAVWANGDLTNTGNLDFKAAAVTSVLQWTGKLTNSGTLSTTTALTNLDFQFFGDTALWYNNTATNAKFAQGDLTNSGTISAPDGFLSIGLEAGAIDNSGTLSAKNYMQLWTQSKGGIVNSGTVTSANGNVSALAEDGDVTNSGAMSGASWVGLSADSILEANPHQVTNSGKLTSATNYVQLISNYGGVTNTASGTISGTSAYFYANFNAGTLPGHNTNAGTINITAPGGEVGFYNYGNGDIIVGGTVQATGAGNYIGYFSAAHSTSNDAKGMVKIDTPIAVMADKGNTSVFLAGEKVFINAPMMVSEATPGAGAGEFEVFGTNNTGANHTHINADLTAGNFVFGTYNGGGSGTSAFDMNVMLDGDLTTTVGGYRSVELYEVSNVIGPGVITANHVAIDASGSVRNPTGVDYLFNGLQITTVGTSPQVEFTARGPAFQAINLDITGDAIVSSGQSVIAQNPCYSGLCIVPSGGYIPQSNAGSSLIVQASGNLTVVTNSFGSNYLGGGSGGLSATNGFLFPGAVVLIAGGALNVNTVVDNAWTATAAPFQGIFFEGATINATLPIYTNGNSFVNYSVRPNGGVGLSTVYNAKAGTNFLGFANLTAVINPLGSFLNSYTVIETALANGEDWLSLVNTTPFTQ